MRTFRITAILLLLTLMFAACQADQVPAADTTAADATAAETASPLPPIVLDNDGPAYTIVRGDEAASDEIQAAIVLNRILNKCGLNTTITTDWAKNPVSDYELVVGQTTRPDLDSAYDIDLQSVGEKGFIIQAVGSRIYICGGTPAATFDAVEYFLATFFDSTPNAAGAVRAVSIPGDYVYTAYETHALTAIRVSGRSLREFGIVWDNTLSAEEGRSAAEYLQNKLMLLTGFWLPIMEGIDSTTRPVVRLAAGGKSRFSTTVSDGNLLMTAAEPNLLIQGIADFINTHIRYAEGELDMNTSFTHTANLDSYVLYSSFGAKGDGKTDDSEAIRAAHEYANANGVAVRADPGATYYIGVMDKAIHVHTNTDWTGASFIIDDRKVGLDKRGVSVFYVTPDKATYDLTGKIKTASRSRTKFDLTLPEDSILVLTEAGTKRYIREGANANSGSDQVDIVVVDKNGNIDMNAPLIWDYTNITSIKVYPMDEKPLILRGGTFTTIANTQPSASTYYSRGIHVSRSNVIVEDLVHYVEGEGAQGAPYNGILTITDCANTTVRDCVFTAHKTYKNNHGANGATVSQGTYDINPSRAVNLTFENCTQTTDILDTAYWGLMGSNFCKNITLKNCTFSRFDAHQGVANITIIGSTLGHQCLNAIGTGTLLVEDSTLYGSSFINLRSDYGSTWEGDVIIRNCTWVPNKGNTLTGKYAVIGGSYSGYHDFGYTCYMPANITIEGLHINDSLAGAGYKGIYLLGDITPAWTNEAYEADVQKNGYPYHITEQLTISGFTSDSGKKWLLSPNEYMFRNVKVTDLDAKN
ncbi:MAG: hypothetical protein IJC15_04815 [Clostridia bacterium]|nr:hypothetical protein [Clostridia bacterium]